MVSATENALINTLETPLAVAWVWVCFSEALSIANFAGDMIVMAAVVGHIWHSSRLRITAAATRFQPHGLGLFSRLGIVASGII